MGIEEIKEIIENEILEEKRKFFNNRISAKGLEESMIDAYIRYEKEMYNEQKNFQKRHKLTDEQISEGWECYFGLSEEEWEKISDDYDVSFATAQDNALNHPDSKYWNLKIEHDDVMIDIVYWSEWYWYKFDGIDFIFKLRSDIHKAIKKSHELTIQQIKQEIEKIKNMPVPARIGSSPKEIADWKLNQLKQSLEGVV